MVSGESLLNDATSIICVVLFLGLNSGKTFTAGEMVLFICNQLIFSVLWGILVGIATITLLRFMKVLDAHTLFALSIATPYLAFIMSTYYFKDGKSGAGGSGVLSLIPVGLFFNNYMAGLAHEEQVHTIQEFWETLSFLATSWLYSLTGLLVGIELASKSVLPIDWASLIGIYVWMVLARFTVVFMSLPVFKWAPGGYGFNVREAVLLAWGGLRGAVGLLLALIIKGNPNVTAREGQLVLFMMAGIVVLVQIQGITFPLLLKFFKVVILPNARVHETMRTKMSYRAFFVLTRAGVDPDVARDILQCRSKEKYKDGGKQEPAVKRFSTRRRETVMLNDPDMSMHVLINTWVSKSVLNDKRRRLLQAQRATYNSLISRELITRAAWLILTRGVEVQLDKDEISLNQWDYLLENTPRVCCNSLGTHSTEVKALLNALFAQDLKNYVAIRDELKQKQLLQSQRSRNRASLRMSGRLHKASFAPATDGSSSTGCLASCFGEEADDAEIGQEMRDRDFGMDCEEALTFGYVSWAYLIAQNHSIQLLADMFKLDDTFTAFEAEQQALKSEIDGSRTEPALYLDTLSSSFPDIARKIKSAQAVAEVKDQVYGYVEELSSCGLIEIHAMKKLIRDADKVVRVVKKLHFPLEPPYSVGPNGVDVLKCPNYHPFFHSEALERMRMEDFEDNDPISMFEEALNEKSSPITEGFWAKRPMDEPIPEEPISTAANTSGEQGAISNEVSFSDATLSQGLLGRQISAEMIPPSDGGGFGVDPSLRTLSPGDEGFEEDSLGIDPSLRLERNTSAQSRLSALSLKEQVSSEDAAQVSDQPSWSGAVKLDSISPGVNEQPSWISVPTPRKPTLAKAKLLRQLSTSTVHGPSPVVNDEAEEGEPAEEGEDSINPQEYHILLTSRPKAEYRASSFYQRKGFNGS